MGWKGAPPRRRNRLRSRIPSSRDAHTVLRGPGRSTAPRRNQSRTMISPSCSPLCSCSARAAASWSSLRTPRFTKDRAELGRTSRPVHAVVVGRRSHQQPGIDASSDNVRSRTPFWGSGSVAGRNASLTNRTPPEATVTPSQPPCWQRHRCGQPRTTPLGRERLRGLAHTAVVSPPSLRSSSPLCAAAAICDPCAAV